jgi:hypothetical protein
MSLNLPRTDTDSFLHIAIQCHPCRLTWGILTESYPSMGVRESGACLVSGWIKRKLCPCLSISLKPLRRLEIGTVLTYRGYLHANPYIHRLELAKLVRSIYAKLVNASCTSFLASRRW